MDTIAVNRKKANGGYSYFDRILLLIYRVINNRFNDPIDDSMREFVTGRFNIHKLGYIFDVLDGRLRVGIGKLMRVINNMFNIFQPVIS
jgi:hypothetical protein